MGKAILVMDMPEECTKCNLYDHEYDVCVPTDKDVRTFGKPDWCPLKTLPNPIDVSGCKTDITKARAQEYNALLAKLSN